MLILKELWLTALNNSDQTTTKAYKQLLLQIATGKEKLHNMVSSEICEMMEVLEDKETELRIMEEYDAFSKGFRLGAKIMLDILGEYSLGKAEIQ